MLVTEYMLSSWTSLVLTFASPFSSHGGEDQMAPLVWTAADSSPPPNVLQVWERNNPVIICSVNNPSFASQALEERRSYKNLAEVH